MKRCDFYNIFGFKTALNTKYCLSLYHITFLQDYLTFWHILLIAALAVASEQAPTGCVRDVFTKRFGHFYYEVWNSSGENCSWLFQPPDNRTDLIFLISIPHIIRYGGNYWNDHIVLPDGEKIISRHSCWKDLQRVSIPSCILSLFAKNCVLELSPGWRVLRRMAKTKMTAVNHHPDAVK